MRRAEPVAPESSESAGGALQFDGVESEQASLGRGDLRGRLGALPDPRHLRREPGDDALAQRGELQHPESEHPDDPGHGQPGRQSGRVQTGPAEPGEAQDQSPQLEGQPAARPDRAHGQGTEDQHRRQAGFEEPRHRIWRLPALSLDWWFHGYQLPAPSARRRVSSLAASPSRFRYV